MRNGQAYQRIKEKFSVSEKKSLVRLTPAFLYESVLKSFSVQVSLAIRGGYISYKSLTANTKTSVLGLIYAKNSSYPSLFAVFSDF